MGKLIKLSSNSWRHPFTDRKKELPLWNTHAEVADLCNLKDGTKRLLRIKFEDTFDIDEIGLFQITSGRKISFTKALQDRIRKIIFSNPDSYFTVTVLDYYDTLFGPSDIMWIKNVKRDGGANWAYDKICCGEAFLLNWPSSKKGSASTPNIGDIIVLFQKPNYINGRKNYDVHLTHLVTPISTEVIIDEDHPQHKWCRMVKLIAMANPIESIPNPGHFNFFLPNRGLTNPIGNLKNNIGISEEETKESVWSLFQNHVCPNIKNELILQKNLTEDHGESEGDKVVKEHIKQEFAQRNSRVVQLAKRNALIRGNGRILCECCNFDFVSAYGIIGTHFIECHHKVPISKGQRITKSEDLALLCSNCHRMLHRKNNKNEYFTVDELKEIIINQKNMKGYYYE